MMWFCSSHFFSPGAWPWRRSRGKNLKRNFWYMIITVFVFFRKDTYSMRTQASMRANRFIAVRLKTSFLGRPFAIVKLAKPVYVTERDIKMNDIRKGTYRCTCVYVSNENYMIFIT